nr:hypothetical protein [uncultured Albidiferax sp.]
MSSSKSSQQANTSTTDQRRVLGEGALSAENSNVFQTQSTVHNTLDAEVANRAMDTARLSTAEALGFGSDSMAAAFSFGKSALTTSANSQADAFGGALSAIDKAGMRAANSQADAFGFGSSAFSGALGAVDKADSRAFSFGGDALASAFSFANDAAKRENAVLDQTTGVLSDAYADAKGRGALTDKILIGAICAVALIAYMAIKK